MQKLPPLFPLPSSKPKGLFPYVMSHTHTHTQTKKENNKSPTQIKNMKQFDIQYFKILFD
jgi:hypothetical protein